MLFGVSLRVRRCFFNLLMVVLLGILFFLLNFMLLGTQTISSADDRLQTIYDGEEYYFIYKDFEADDWGIFNNSVERLNELKQFLKEVSEQKIFNIYLQNLLISITIQNLFTVIEKNQMTTGLNCSEKFISEQKHTIFLKMYLKNLYTK